MSFLFSLALVIGGGLFLLSLAGDLLGIDSHDGHAFHADHDTEWSRLFSIRNATYFLFAFGAVGVLLNWIWQGDNTLMTALFAAGTGAFAWFMSYAAFRYLRRTDTGAMHGDRLLVGRIGTVTLPLLKGSTGKILVERLGQTQELLARPLDDEETNPEAWKSVLIIDVRDGVALVGPKPSELDSTEE